ncbi:hypothetical protein CGCS363_v013332 [Colletotrichum siamense]|uniref:uncharacterized protein n=1 Tax=Colletotrichum siamense TaxID=690259 RepID=UPI0018726742|nr:uncharacterized protein CGCS363_v013332 [Colletotrichum siamense]KAF5487366.1 hypothetical protein CGCS363_v013332 [Colletotrichum siamense]
MKDGIFSEMFSHTMALKPLLLWTLIFTLSVTVTATSFNLSSEITRFIPTCARQCFRSHLSANYALTTCGSAPTLECLCANVGFTGLTIGEGAFQCIVAEKAIGSCRESDSPQTVIDAAYLMCSNLPGAVTPTHTAIIATLILPSTGAGIIIVPAPSTSAVVYPTSTTRHLTTTSIPTTLITATGSVSVPSPSFSTITRSNTSVISTTSSTTTSTSTTASTSTTPLPPPPATTVATTTQSASATAVPGAEESNSGSSERLGTAQVAGLAVGIAAAVGIAILAICLARRKRRRDYPDVKTGFFPVREKDSWEFHPQEGPANIFHISPPLHHARSPSPPLQPPPAARTRTSARTSWWPGAIGLAISRPQSTGTPKLPQQQQARPTSRLLPAKPSLSSPKPVLSIKIPKIDLYSSSPPQPQEQQGPSQQTNSQILNERTAKLTAPPRTHYNLPRESTMTEFEEDGALTSAPVTSARSQRSNNIWRPPSAATGKTPQSATTYYVADKNGNWVLGDPKSATHMAQLAELDASGASAGGGAKSKPSYAESAMLAATASKAGIGHGAGSPIAPTAPRMPMPPAPVLLPAAEIVPSNLSAPHQSRSSSVYSQNTTRPNTTFQPGVPLPNGASHPVPSMSFSHPEPPRRRSNSLGRRSSSKSKQPPAAASSVPVPSATAATPQVKAPQRSDSHDSHVSQASVTTIASSAATDPDPILEQSNLSPVVESPASNTSPTGRSPVSYPVIPGRTSSKPGNNLRLLAPPTRQFAALPPGQPSPTLGMLQQQQQQQQARGPYMASYDVPRKPIARPRPSADPNRIATGSPSLRLVTPSPPSDTERDQSSRPPQMKPLYPPPLQPQRPRLERGDAHPQAQTAQVQQMPPNVEPQSASVYKALWGDAPRPLPVPPQQNHPQPPPRSHRRISQQQQQQQQQQPNSQSFQQRASRQSLQNLPQQSPPPKQPLPARPSASPSPSPHHIATQTLTAPLRPASEAASVATPLSTTSSLLSKRLGTERAAALAPLQHNANGGTRHSPNWRPYRPGAGGDMLFSPDEFFPAPPIPGGGDENRGGGGLPATPTWQPKLTPTRRGDDLFLNVQ